MDISVTALEKGIFVTVYPEYYLNHIFHEQSCYFHRFQYHIRENNGLLDVKMPY